MSTLAWLAEGFPTLQQQVEAFPGLVATLLAPQEEHASKISIRGSEHTDLSEVEVQRPAPTPTFVQTEASVVECLQTMVAFVRAAEERQLWESAVATPDSLSLSAALDGILGGDNVANELNEAIRVAMAIQARLPQVPLTSNKGSADGWATLQDEVHDAYCRHHAARFIVEVLTAMNGKATFQHGDSQPSDLLGPGPIRRGPGGPGAMMLDGKEYLFWTSSACGSSERACDEFIVLSRRIGARLRVGLAGELGMVADAEPLAVWWLFMLKRLEGNPHFVVTTPTYQAIINPIGAMVHALKLVDDLPALSPTASALYDLLMDQPPHKPLLGSEILKLLQQRGVHTEQSTLTSRLVPELIPYGIENTPRKGYRIPASRRPQQMQH